MSNFFVKRDTSSWIIQTWAAFAIAVFLCVVALWQMPSASLDRAFMAIGMLFVLSSTFTLSKTIRDNQEEQVDTKFWIVQVWCAFAFSIALTAWGIFRMNIEPWHKWFVVASSIFLLSAAFSLAKTLRDKHDADVIEQAK